MRFSFAALAFCLAFSLPLTAAEMATTIKETELKKEPFSDAATLATLPSKTSVEILNRQGGWTQVKPASADKGWVRMLNLRIGDGSARQGSSGGGIGALFNVARTGSSGTTVATGVRGLDITKDTLQNATPNPNELKRMHSYTASKADALKLASSANLHKQKVEYADAGSSRSSSGSSPTSSWGE